jgi:hypothetical protein
VITEDEMAERLDGDRQLIREAAAEAKLEPIGEGDAYAVLLALVDETPAIRPALERALPALNRERATLDFGLSLGLGVLVVALGGALLRPRFHRERTEEVNADGSRRIQEATTVELQGVEDVGTVIKELLPFVTGEAPE